MTQQRATRTPAQLLVLFIIFSALPLAALGWLGWRLMEQERILEMQRTRDVLDNAAGIAVREVERSLQSWDDMLTAGAQVTHSDVAIVTMGPSGVVRRGGLKLPYYPVAAPPQSLPAGIFDAAEEAEFRQDGLDKAIEMYRALTSTPNSNVRAAALARLARCLRKQQRPDDAIRVYGDLAAMADTVVSGSPAQLLAHHERIALWKAARDEAAVLNEAKLLGSALAEGRFLIDRATFEFFRESSAMPAVGGESASSLAEAAERFWPSWLGQPAGRTAVPQQGHAIVSLWRRTSAGTTAILGDVNQLLAKAPVLQARITIESTAGEVVWGEASRRTESITKSLRDVGLPLTLRAAVTTAAGTNSAWTARRNLLAAGFGFLIVVLLSSAYFVFRSVNRELSVARLQSDFVAAVSHEFRTPLTAMCHMTEMLEEGHGTPERLPHYYRALRNETKRLHAMVESLLDFGRMESGRRVYEMEETDAAALVGGVLDQFREQSPSAADRLHWQAPGGDWRIRADQEAIALAVRNLVDNAIKYSPSAAPVKVAIGRIGAQTSISVEDQGPGIAKNEQREVFRKFVRGTSTKNQNVKGSGLGLAIVDQIVKAHGGRVELDSELGHGSRFTILLPTLREQS